MIPLTAHPVATIEESPQPKGHATTSDNRHHHNTYGQTAFQKIKPGIEHDLEQNDEQFSENGSEFTNVEAKNKINSPEFKPGTFLTDLQISENNNSERGHHGISTTQIRFGVQGIEQHCRSTTDMLRTQSIDMHATP